MASLFQAARYLASASESEAAERRARKQVETAKKAAEKQQGNRGLTAQQSARLRLAEAATRAYARNRGELGLQRSPGTQSVQRMAALLQAIDRNRAAGKPLGNIFAKRRS